ncbi:MAG: HEAT repeat domain-containing protein [Planctomycetota bacterium]
MMRSAGWCIPVVLISLVANCTRGAPWRASIQSNDVNERILAVREAAEKGDKASVPALVDRLEDEDEAVRFFAILSLEKITGSRFGYDYGQPAWRRARSVEKWRLYVKDPQGAVAMDSQDRQGSGAGGETGPATERHGSP